MSILAHCKHICVKGKIDSILQYKGFYSFWALDDSQTWMKSILKEYYITILIMKI